jgi:hypothetical protein
MQNASLYLVPDVLSFDFKNIKDGVTTKLTFYSAMKMNDFIIDVKEKIRHIHNVYTYEKIEIIEAEKGEQGEPLDIENDETLLRDKYARNYKQVAFYVRVLRLE